LRALVGRNRFIAPIGRAPPRTLDSGASGGDKRRNKAIAPYDLQFASFNFTSALICVEASSARPRQKVAACALRAGFELATFPLTMQYARRSNPA
jgi:hypothetical protein